MTEAVGRLGTLPRAEPARWRFDLRWILIGVPVALVVWLAIVPLTFLLWQSFFTPHTAAEPAVFTLGNYPAAYTTGEIGKALRQLGGVRRRDRRFSLVVGTALAWMNERTNTPFKGLFFAWR